jgi:hypothetical protein
MGFRQDRVSANGRSRRDIILAGGFNFYVMNTHIRQINLCAQRVTY